MPYLVSDIFTRVSKTLYDEAGVVWNNQSGADSELMQHLNAAISDIVDLDPKAKVFDGPLPLVSGIKQLLPGDAVAIIDVTHNMGSDGATPGPNITVISSLKHARRALRNWANSPPSPIIRHWVADDRDPRVYWNWPPVPAGVTVYANTVYAQVPDDLVNLTDPFPLPDMYAEAAWAYVVSHAFMRNDKYGDPKKASMFNAAYLQTMGQASTTAQKTRVGRSDA